MQKIAGKTKNFNFTLLLFKHLRRNMQILWKCDPNYDYRFMSLRIYVENIKYFLSP